MRAKWIVAAIVVLVTCDFALAQEKPTVPPQQLVAALDQSAAIADEVLRIRRAFPDEITGEQFLRGIAPLQERFEPVLSLIIETNPPREMQQLAMLIAMGAKGVELSVWHYIYALMTSDSRHLEIGDEHLSVGLDQLSAAGEMSQQFR